MEKREYKPVVSVVTATYNLVKNGRADFFHEMMSSIGNQNCDRNFYEHIVVDGGSCDGTLELLENYHQKGQIDYLTSEPDRGIYDAMNKGRSQATGRYLLFLNSDDRLHDTSVFADVAPLLTDGVEKIYCGDVSIIDEKGREVGEKHLKPEIIFYGMPTCQQGMFLPVSIFDIVGPFDAHYKIAGDYDYFWKLHESGFPIERLCRIISDFREDGISMTSLDQRWKETDEVLFKHFILKASLEDTDLKITNDVFWDERVVPKKDIVRFYEKSYRLENSELLSFFRASFSALLSQKKFYRYVLDSNDGVDHITIIIVCNDDPGMEETIESIAGQQGNFKIHCHLVVPEDGNTPLSLLSRWRKYLENASKKLLRCRAITITDALCHADDKRGLDIPLKESGGYNFPLFPGMFVTWIEGGDQLAPGSCQKVYEIGSKYSHVRWLTGCFHDLDPGSRKSCARGYPTEILKQGLADGYLWPRLKMTGTFIRWNILEAISFLTIPREKSTLDRFFQDLAGHVELFCYEHPLSIAAGNDSGTVADKDRGIAAEEIVERRLAFFQSICNDMIRATTVNLIGAFPGYHVKSVSFPELPRSTFRAMASLGLGPNRIQELPGADGSGRKSRMFRRRNGIVWPSGEGRIEISRLIGFLRPLSPAEKIELRVIQRSGLFDYVYYTRENHDVIESRREPLAHFVTSGCREGRKPNRYFDCLWYLATYPEVEKLSVSPLLHYILLGAESGYDPGPDFSTCGYLENNQDVKESGVNPLFHYMCNNHEV